MPHVPTIRDEPGTEVYGYSDDVACLAGSVNHEEDCWQWNCLDDNWQTGVQFEFNTGVKVTIRLDNEAHWKIRVDADPNGDTVLSKNPEQPNGFQSDSLWAPRATRMVSANVMQAPTPVVVDEPSEIIKPPVADTAPISSLGLTSLV